ncbi:hypothetical protein ACFL3G_10750 [Planctomycetota bacterium]
MNRKQDMDMSYCATANNANIGSIATHLGFSTKCLDKRVPYLAFFVKTGGGGIRTPVP